jgi:hypothetical protein
LWWLGSQQECHGKAKLLMNGQYIDFGQLN